MYDAMDDIAKLTKGFLKVLSVIAAVMILITIFLGVISYKKTSLLNKGCEEIGLNSYIKQGGRPGGFEFCDSQNGDLYYVKSKCDYSFVLFPEKCKINQISVGDVRIKR